MADKTSTLRGANIPGIWMTRTDPSLAPKPDPHSCYAMIDSKSIQLEAIIGDVPCGDTLLYLFR